MKKLLYGLFRFAAILSMAFTNKYLGEGLLDRQIFVAIGAVLGGAIGTNFIIDTQIEK